MCHGFEHMASIGSKNFRYSGPISNNQYAACLTHLVRLSVNFTFISFCFSGQVVFNYTKIETNYNSIYGIVEDETTPGAIILADWCAIVRMYPNGTKEVVMGKEGSAG